MLSLVAYVLIHLNKCYKTLWKTLQIPPEEQLVEKEER